MQNITGILLGAIAIGAVHAVIPNHWLPLVTMAKAEGWSHRRALSITFLVACFHVLGTILVGLAVSAFGIAYIHGKEAHAEQLSQYILILVGLFFIWGGLRHSQKCNHHRLRLVGGGPEEHATLRQFGVIFALSAAMFLSPCVDIIGYFLSVSLMGWDSVILLSIVFTLTTIPILVGLVALGLIGVDKLNWKLLDHHGRTITGLLLVVLGITNSWFE